MFSLLLAIIYLAFISLGLPDSILGSGWPVMHGDLNVPTSFVGIISMTMSAGTIVSSLLSDRLIHKLGVGLITTISAMLTALGMIGFSLSHSFIELCFWAVPYGLGAGAVDAALNNYVAIHYSSRQMSWLHGMWGVGASISPYIMSGSLTYGAGWQSGYRMVGIIQMILMLIFFATLKMWKTGDKSSNGASVAKSKPLGVMGALRIKGVPFVLLSFFGYCSMENTAMTWVSSYLVTQRAVDAVTAARFASLFLMGITAGRFLTGFFVDKVGDTKMIQVSGLIVIFGIVMIILPVSSSTPALAGLMVMGLGCAPIYPAVVHSTPVHFGRENSQAIVGIQMASVYIGSTFMPPLFGLLSNVAMWAFPWYMLFFMLVMYLSHEMLIRTLSKTKSI